MRLLRSNGVSESVSDRSDANGGVAEDAERSESGSSSPSRVTRARGELEYIAEMSIELRRMAVSAGCDVLSELLAMAAIAAEEETLRGGRSKATTRAASSRE